MQESLKAKPNVGQWTFQSMCDSVEEGDLGLGSSLTALTATRVRLVGMQGDAV